MNTTTFFARNKFLPFWDPLVAGPRFEKTVASLAPKDAVWEIHPVMKMEVIP
jgi:hypothetical protein